MRLLGLVCPGNMRRWETLNNRQLMVLQRVADSTDPVSSKTPDLATTVYALRSRGLVHTPRREGIWHAELTEAGRFYLEHGHHPDRPEPEKAAVISPREPKAAAQKTDLASDLIRELHAGDGTITIDEPDDELRARYRRAISAAKRRGLVPVGKQLLHTGRDTGPLIIKLAEAGPAAQTSWNRVRTLARDEISGDQMLEMLSRDQSVLAVSDGLRARTVELVRSLARKASRRGHIVAITRKKGRLVLRVREHQFTIKISEEIDEVPKRLPADDPRLRRAYSWQRITPPEYESVPSGQLRLELSPHTPHAHEWGDAGKAKIESRLNEVLAHAEQQADAADAEAVERERQQEAWRAQEQQRQQQRLAEQKERETKATAAWESAMEAARNLAVEDLRQRAFGDALLGWVTAGQIRGFCTALAQIGTEGVDPAGLDGWIAWANAWADKIDPLHHPSDFAGLFDPEPSPDDLRPHLGEWSPFRPEKEYRPASSPERRPTSASYASEVPTWILARQGRFPWWRR